MARLDFRGAAATLTIPAGTDDAATVLTLSGDTSGWPTGAGGRHFMAIIDRGVAGKTEKVLCTTLIGTTLAVTTRGYDGTTAVAHDAGCTIEHGLGASVIDDLSAHVYDTARDDHGQYVLVDGTRGFSAVDALVDEPVSIGAANAEGSSALLARADHVHVIGAAKVTPAMLTAAAGIHLASWANYTPGMVQSSAVAVTVTDGRCRLVGHTMEVQGDVSATQAGTAGATLQLSLPKTGDASLFTPVLTAIGHSIYGVASVTAGGVEYQCTAVYNDNPGGIPYLAFKRCDAPSAGYIGTDPNVAVGIGGRVRFAVAYEVS